MVLEGCGERERFAEASSLKKGVLPGFQPPESGATAAQEPPLEERAHFFKKNSGLHLGHQF